MYDAFQQFFRSGKMLSQFGFEGAKFAIAKSFGHDNTTSSLENLRHILGNAKGPIMKIAQILGTIPDLLPPEQAEIFRSLQTSAPPMGSSFVKRRMKGELGQDWETLFKEFELTPTFAASLGQVHKALTLDQQSVACKLQYPDMNNAIEADLTQLKLFFKGFKLYNSTLDTTSLLEEISDRLKEEIDYLQEAQMLTHFAGIFQNHTSIHVPQVITELTTQRLLTMTWLEGESILWMEQQSIELRTRSAYNLFQAWYFPFYKAGCIHADPHFGNYTLTPQGEVNIFDFGCVRVFEPDFLKSVLRLFEGLFKKDNAICLQAYQEWGFEGVSLDNVHLLNMWANLLYGPLLEDKVRPLQDNHSGLKGKETLFQLLEELQKSETLKIPREFIFLDRATVGIGSALLRLKTEQNWHQLFLDILEKTGHSLNI